MWTVAGSDHLDQLSTRVGTGVWTQDLSDESLAPYRSELSGQPGHASPTEDMKKMATKAKDWNKGKYAKDETPDSIYEYKTVFSCTFLVTKNGEITAAEGVRDRFFFFDLQLKIRKNGDKKEWSEVKFKPRFPMMNWRWQM